MPGDTTNLNNKATAQNTYDAIVIGSGISGGWAAKELTEKGLKVLMLERGKDHQHIKDYKNATKDPWDFEYAGRTTEQQKKDYPVIHRGWAANEAVMDGWTNEIDSPYTEIKPRPVRHMQADRRDCLRVLLAPHRRGPPRRHRENCGRARRFEHRHFLDLPARERRRRSGLARPRHPQGHERTDHLRLGKGRRTSLREESAAHDPRGKLRLTLPAPCDSIFRLLPLPHDHRWSSTTAADGTLRAVHDFPFGQQIVSRRAS